MKPELMRLRRALAGTVAALLLAAGIVVLSPALSASAHDNAVSASCDYGLSVSLTSYPRNSTVTVVIDGVTKTNGAEAFFPGWSANYSWDGTIGHSYTVSVVSPDDPINPSTLQGARGWTFTKSGTVKGCPPPDSPQLSITGQTCAGASTNNGTISFTLTGVSTVYTISLVGTSKTITSSGGSGSFTGVAPGTYTITATTPGGPSATSGPVTLLRCTPTIPVIALDVEPCVSGGALGAVTANLSNLTIGSAYTIRLFSADDMLLDTLALTASGATATLSFPGHGPGTYFATVTDPSDKLLATSASTTIGDCTPELTIAVQLEPCVPPMLGIAGGNRGLAPMALLPMAPTTAEREISVQVDGLAPGTVYTVQLVSTDAAHTVIGSTATPGDNASTFAHTFTNVPSPGDYIVEVTGGTLPLSSDPITAPLCDLTTMAPPSIEATVDQCNGVDPAEGALSARLIDLDPTKTYYVRIVDSLGATVVGGDDQQVTGVMAVTVHFPGITAPGTYTAWLLIDPGKQLAATDPNAVTIGACLPTLAMTGPGALFPLGSVAALLLTLGGAVVVGRLRRRMAL